jgi:hypothetical protein
MARTAGCCRLTAAGAQLIPRKASLDQLETLLVSMPRQPLSHDALTPTHPSRPRSVSPDGARARACLVREHPSRHFPRIELLQAFDQRQHVARMSKPGECQSMLFAFETGAAMKGVLSAAFVPAGRPPGNRPSCSQIIGSSPSVHERSRDARCVMVLSTCVRVRLFVAGCCVYRACLLLGSLFACAETLTHIDRHTTEALQCLTFSVPSRTEAKEYLRDKKGPSKFCGNTLSLQAPKELAQSKPVGILRITQGPTTITDKFITRIQRVIPSVEVQRAEGEVALLILTIPEERADEGAALLLKAQQTWRWRTAFQNPQRFLAVLRSLCLQRGQSNPEELTLRHIAQDAVDIMWEGQAGHQHAMTIGNAASQYREEHSWWAKGPTCLEQLQEWKQWVQHCHTAGDSKAPECVTIANASHYCGLGRDT